MYLINFSLKKNNKTIINKKNIKSISTNDKFIFKIDDTKYSYKDKVLTKTTDEEEIVLDFNKKECLIYLIKHKHKLFINITNVKIKTTKNNIKIEYIIETEDNTLNIINIEYKKSS